MQTKNTAEFLEAQGFSTTFEARFWAKVAISDGCWLWTARLNNKGYGMIVTIGHRGPLILAHRASWILHHGPIPEGKCVLHDCPQGDCPACVRPDHLWLGSKADNTHDMMKKERGGWAKRVEPFGELHWHAKLTADQVIAIRNDTRLHRLIAMDFGLDRSTVTDIKRRKTWRHLAA